MKPPVSARATGIVGLAWLLAHDDSTLLIPGTSSLAHLEQNMAVAAVQLTDSQVAQLDAVAPPK